MTVFKAACVQTTAVPEIEPNLKAVGDLIRRARDQGADLIMTPEVSDMIEPKRTERLRKAKPEAENALLGVASDLAKEAGAWILLGSVTVRLEGDKLANRSLLVGPDGRVAARYDKIHMFDVDLPNGERYRESAVFEPGQAGVLATLPWGTLGMTICYDLRFPHLYRSLGHGGADFLTVPSAFTVPTGKAHWHVLLRSRAIENGAFVFAPAQWGQHHEGRKTYGHSLIISPWGEVLADGGEEGTGVIVAEIDTAKIAEARASVPSLRHDRPFSEPPQVVKPLAAE